MNRSFMPGLSLELVFELQPGVPMVYDMPSVAPGQLWPVYVPKSQSYEL